MFLSSIETRVDVGRTRNAAGLVPTALVFRASPSFDFHTGSHRNIYFLLFVNVGLKILRYYLPLMIKLRIENTESRSLELTFPEKIDPGLRIQTCKIGRASCRERV